MRGSGRGNPALRVQPDKVERMPGLRGQLCQIEKLRPPVPLAEGVDIVHVPMIRPAAVAKSARFKPCRKAARARRR